MKIIVVGAGASGLLAAAIAIGNGHEVTVLEKTDRAGFKLSITGKGRCNLTNSCDNQTFLNNVTTNAKFLYSAINTFSCYDTYDLFEKLGVKLKIERGNRVFPQSDNAKDVVNALLNYNNVKNHIIYNSKVSRLITENGVVKGVLLSNNKRLSCDVVMICTGGKSYPKTGSTGDGYLLANQVGHSTKTIKPSLIPIECKEKFCADLMGLSLRNVLVSVFEEDKCIYKEQGEMLFTHFGISGPVILSASAHIKNISNCKICIDLKPALSFQQLDSRILRDFSKYSNKSFKNALNDLLPKKMVDVFVKLCGIDPDFKVNQITKSMRDKIVELMKCIPLNAASFRPVDEAIITKGGINVIEIEPKTMQSKLCKNLYFCGEVIDVDAYTGGFNLQIAFSTAYVAANSL